MLNTQTGREQRYQHPCCDELRPADQRTDYDAKLKDMYDKLVEVNDEIYYAREDGWDVSQSFQERDEILSEIDELTYERNEAEEMMEVN